MFLFRSLVLAIGLICAVTAYGQAPDTVANGSITGIVRDTARNRILPSATLAIYQVKDSGLVSYRLADNYGVFRFDHLPVGVPLQLVASFIGFKTWQHRIVLTRDHPSLEIADVDLVKGEDLMDEVVVRAVVPVRMKGDTLEFNPEAFRMDPNAVVEDLFRKLPGLIVWGDGTITVNGRKISQVLVDGKPFFGSDPRIATQNIPKNAVDRIQVYQEKQSSGNPFDSITMVNIRLKKGKDAGLFGKVAVGAGTSGTYESDGNVNLFSSRMQLGLVGAGNNINKVPVSVDQLIQSSSYKGVGASVSYQPDFSLPGVEKSLAGGFTFYKDLLPVRGRPESENDVRAKYLFQKNDNLIRSSQQTTSALGKDSSIVQTGENSSSSRGTEQQLETDYRLLKKSLQLRVNADLRYSELNSQDRSSQNSVLNKQVMQSASTIENDSHSKGGSAMFDINLVLPKLNASSPAPGRWEFDYKLKTEENKGDESLNSNFSSFAASSQSQFLSRSYDRKSSSTLQDLRIGFGSWSDWLFGTNSFFSNMDMDLQNELKYTFRHNEQDVRDWDTAMTKYLADSYLTGYARYAEIVENPGINLSRTLVQRLADRYEKNWILSFKPMAQIVGQSNRSSHSFQNFDRSYTQFVPTAGLEFQNNQFGSHIDQYRLSYGVVYDYATPDQLYPLVDSSNPYLVYRGNPRLRPSRTQQLHFSFTHGSLKTGRLLSYNLEASSGITSSYLADSVVVTASGGYQHYPVNINGRRFGDLQGWITKAIKINGGSQLTSKLLTHWSWQRIPGYLSSAEDGASFLNVSSQTNGTAELSFEYLYGGLLAVNLKEGLGFYSARQQGDGVTNLNNDNSNTSLSASVNPSGRLNASSNVTYNSYGSKGSPTTHFTIWNASTAYRFLNGKNLEVKFSALDLLHQNKSVFNRGETYSITHGTSNVLQQYFMLTVAFYPRKFGK